MALRMYVIEGIRVAGIMTASDLFAQFIIEKQQFSKWDYWRTVRFGCIGLVYVGPLLTKWYNYLETIVPVDRKSPIKSGIKKMLIDQTCFAPLFTLSLTFVVPYAGGTDLGEVLESIRQNYFSIMWRSYMLWPAAQIVNFTFVPIQYQVLYAQFVAFIWNCYLATKLN